MSRTPDDYKNAIKGSLPQGAAFTPEGAPNRDGMIEAMSKELSSEDILIDTLKAEANPKKANLMLPEWEKEAGLPECAHQGNLTKQERLKILNEKLDRVGSWNIHAVKQMCIELGYDVEIVNHKPFVGGISCGGDRVGGGHEMRLWRKVKVKGPRVTYFRSGQSTGGEKLLTIRRADDLECVLKKACHSDQKVTMSYEGT
ncbi:putative phage tail protein [Terasakiella sp. A23]|uniref:putative phage tail protein n=1 Tax=Terasakiella sp. FCG-A23 TaxID=3080561 RepID=UPI0029544FA8|nr:putative phage tail protein [Terasakiella sp. A23]MDV7340963.1 putative phage tail protein [Terasakiella sp. A23]